MPNLPVIMPLINDIISASFCIRVSLLFGFERNLTANMIPVDVWNVDFESCSSPVYREPLWLEV